jgi:hypothetical protein
MAKALHMSNVAVNAEATAISALLNLGKIYVYSGTQPADAETAVTAANVILATVTLAATAFGAATAGVLTAAAISAVTVATTGTAAWYRVCQAASATAVMWDGSVGITSNQFDMVVNTTSLVSGATFTISSFTHTIPKA